MQRPLQITFHGIEPSEFVEQRIREKAAELERFGEQVTGCHVMVEAPHRQHQKGNIYIVRVNISVPGDQIVVGQERRNDHAHEDVYVAIRDSFEAAVRQLEESIRQRRDAQRQAPADQR